MKSSDTFRRIYKEEPLIYSWGETVDFSGVIVDDHIIYTGDNIHASDYSEWQSKRSHEIMLPEKDKKLWSIVWSIGKKLGAPKWLREEVFWFFKKAQAVKTSYGVYGKAIYYGKEKYVYAVYYVVAKKRGLYSLAQTIASMPCNSLGEPCYVSRKKGDPEFKKYLRIVNRYAAIIYPNVSRDPVTMLDQIVTQHQLPIPDIVHKRAREIAVKIQEAIGGRKANTVVAAVLKLAIDEIMPKNKALFSMICKKLNVSEVSVQNFIKFLQKNGILETL